MGHHHDDILCGAIHPEGKLMATGQIGKDPTIIVWDTEKMAKLSVMAGFHIRGVCAVGFSPDGTQVRILNIQFWRGNDLTYIRSFLSV